MDTIGKEWEREIQGTNARASEGKRDTDEGRKRNRRSLAARIISLFRAPSFEESPYVARASLAFKLKSLSLKYRGVKDNTVFIITGMYADRVMFKQRTPGNYDK